MFQAEVLTLFPRMVEGYAGESILAKAQERGLLAVRAVDIRSFALDKHRVTDDAPYGGGAGMVMKVEPLSAAILDAKTRLPTARVLLMSPRGQTFSQEAARRLAGQSGGLIFVCGRYEGVDERVMGLVDEEVSLGDFVLTGGELAALAVVDAVARLLPEVLGNDASALAESFEHGLLEHPHYTRPPDFQGRPVPPVLQSGDHARIARWRRWKALTLTRERRPDLWARFQPTPEDLKLLKLQEDEL
jgi:tRNA (guanine37-N1)-methyltransferase